MKTTPKIAPEKALEIMIAGVAALSAGTSDPRAPRRFTKLQTLLTIDLRSFRKASGLATAWPEERKTVLAEMQEEEKHATKAAAEREEKQVANAAKGRELWGVIHRRALSYIPTPENAKAEVNYLVVELPHQIPGCSGCKLNYLNYLKSHPPQLQSAEAYFGWSVDLHNDVNRQRKVATMTVEEARAIWAKA